MRLAFLMERRYAPYSKWFGTAFSRLRSAAALQPALEAMLAADSFPEREQALVRILEALARMHNALGITAPIDPQVRGFFARPYRVIDAGRFDRALRERIEDEYLRELPSLLGAADQLIDVSSAVKSPILTGRMRSVYGPGPAANRQSSEPGDVE